MTTNIVYVSIHKIAGPGGAWLVRVSDDDQEDCSAATSFEVAKRHARAILDAAFGIEVKQLRLRKHDNYQFFTTEFEVEA